eukprot:TRINITY_DN13521_c0_g1_i1.p1 TRINITY_DN13521_c0_g1~~TRINITY_DN13521_c0_g1_i1.p1  ORF type:complete len:700 (+),score=97.59 TRINITY_DN13521_c0_g1_i1:119-2218(+)
MMLRTAFLTSQYLVFTQFIPRYVWTACVMTSFTAATRSEDDGLEQSIERVLNVELKNGNEIGVQTEAPPWEHHACGPTSTCLPHGSLEIHQTQEFPQTLWTDALSRIKTGDAILYGGIGAGSDRIRAGSCSKSFSHVGIAAVYEKKYYSDGSYYWELVAGPVSNTSSQVLTAMEVANHAAPDLISGDTGGGFQIIPLLWKIGSIIPGSCNCRVTILPLKQSMTTPAKLQKLNTISSCLRVMRMRYQLKDLIRLFKGAYGGLSRSEWALEAMYCSEFVAAVGVEMGWVDLSQLKTEALQRQTCQLPDMATKLYSAVDKVNQLSKIRHPFSTVTDLKTYGPNPENMVPVAMMDPRVAVGYDVGDGFDIDLSDASRANAEDAMGGPFERLEAAGQKTDGFRAPVIAAREIRDRQICDATAAATAGFQDSLGNPTDPDNLLARKNAKLRLNFNRNVLMLFEGDVWYASTGSRNDLPQAHYSKRHLRVFLHVGKKSVQVGLSIPQKAHRDYGEGVMQPVRMGAPEWLGASDLTGIEAVDNGSIHDSYFEKAPWNTLMDGGKYRPLFSTKYGSSPRRTDHLTQPIFSSNAEQFQMCGGKNRPYLDLAADYWTRSKRNMRFVFDSVADKNFVYNLLENLQIAMKHSSFGNAAEAHQRVFEGKMMRFTPSDLHSVLTKHPPTPGNTNRAQFLFQQLQHESNGLPGMN